MNTSEKKDDYTLSVKEAAAALSVSKNAVLRLIARGRLRAMKHATMFNAYEYRISTASLKEWAQTKEQLYERHFPDDQATDQSYQPANRQPTNPPTNPPTHQPINQASTPEHKATEKELHEANVAQGLLRTAFEKIKEEAGRWKGLWKGEKERRLEEKSEYERRQSELSRAYAAVIQENQDYAVKLARSETKVEDLRDKVRVLASSLSRSPQAAKIWADFFHLTSFAESAIEEKSKTPVAVTASMADKNAGGTQTAAFSGTHGAGEPPAETGLLDNEKETRKEESAESSAAPAAVQASGDDDAPGAPNTSREVRTSDAPATSSDNDALTEAPSGMDKTAV